MDLLLAISIPLIVFFLAYLMLNDQSRTPLWLKRLTDSSGAIWTCGVIIIAVISIVRYLTS